MERSALLSTRELGSLAVAVGDVEDTRKVVPLVRGVSPELLGGFLGRRRRERDWELWKGFEAFPRRLVLRPAGDEGFLLVPHFVEEDEDVLALPVTWEEVNKTTLSFWVAAIEGYSSLRG